MMVGDDGTIACDEKGRIVLPRALRERYGDRYLVVDSSDGIWLVPRPEDPVAVLRSLGRGLPNVSIAEIRKAVHGDMTADAVARLERLRREGLGGRRRDRRR